MHRLYINACISVFVCMCIPEGNGRTYRSKRITITYIGKGNGERRTSIVIRKYPRLSIKAQEEARCFLDEWSYFIFLLFLTISDSFDESIVHAGPVIFHDTNAIRATRRLRLPRSLFQRYKMKSFGLRLQRRMIEKRKWLDARKRTEGRET